MRADVDIYPEERRSVIRGHYHLINKHDVAIPELHVYTQAASRIEVTAPAGWC